MMYKNNFVVVIKNKGSVLREKNGCVMLPFGTEYSILLKNLDSRKAVANISVDGDDVLDGKRVIVPGNESVEIKGKMNGVQVKHHFKFIEKTREISEHRGDRPDDGLVRVEYWFEQECVQWLPPITLTSYTCDRRAKTTWYDGSSYSSLCNSGVGSYDSVSCNYTNSLTSGPIGDDGITVQGSKTRQDFSYGYTRALEDTSHVIVIQLRGLYAKKSSENKSTVLYKKIEKAITIKTKFRCPTCGRRSKSSAKWCSNCGTNLEM